MNMKDYFALNELANANGIVLLGGTDDMDIPVGELKQAFELKSDLYNRSVADLSIETAARAYDAYVASLNPEAIILHIGSADLDMFAADPSGFDQKYRDFISYIKVTNPKCRVAITSLKNEENNHVVAEMNKHLKYIASSEQCEFFDLSNKRLWNPKETKEVISFLYSTGFVRPLKIKQPLYDLVKILFCYNAV